MSKVIELKVPDIGNVAEVEVIELAIQPGDLIEIEQSILVMETDKASMELPAIAAGTIQEVKINVGDMVFEGAVVATLLVSEESNGTDKDVVKSKKIKEISKEEIAKSAEKASPAVEKNQAKRETSVIEEIKATGSKKAHATPSIRRFARELGVNLLELKSGTGRKGRILKEDIQKFVKQAMANKNAVNANVGSGIPALPVVDFSKFGDTEEKPLTKIKRLTGKHLSCNWLNLPMVTQHEDADITEMEAFRKSLNIDQVAAKQIKVSPLSFIIKAVLAAMKDYPQFNSSLSADGERLIYKKYFNIGIAVDTPNGLVVPVIKDANQKSLVELAEDMKVLSIKARDGKLLASDMQGGCLTISSLGGIGGTAFTPIVNAPEVAILGVSRASMKPVWNGSEFVPRLMLPLDLTYDHRVIDGADGVRFAVTITKYLNDILSFVCLLPTMHSQLDLCF